MHVANLAQQMARNAESREAVLFQRVALVSMGVMAIAALTQVMMEIFRRRETSRYEHKGDHRIR